MPPPIMARVRAGPPTRGSSIVLISRPLAGSTGISERCGPGLNSPLRNLGNSSFAMEQNTRLRNAQAINNNNNQIGSANPKSSISTPRDDRTGSTSFCQQECSYLLKRQKYGFSHGKIYLIIRVLPGDHPRVFWLCQR